MKFKIDGNIGFEVPDKETFAVECRSCRGKELRISYRDDGSKGAVTSWIIYVFQDRLSVRGKSYK